MIETAIICEPFAKTRIFGRSILDRTVRLLERAGVKRIFVLSALWSDARIAWGSLQYSNCSEIHRIEFSDEVLRKFSLSPSDPCFLISGDVVFGRVELDELIALHSAHAAEAKSLPVSRTDNQAQFSAGPLAKLLSPCRDTLGQPRRAEGLPFSVGVGSTGWREARRRLARGLARETARTDSLFARLLDRKLSWRISRWLAETPVTANQVTLTNTALGLLAALLFGSGLYYQRLIGSLLFLLSITLDGVDGEVARLKLQESRAGARLDVITDNLVNVAIFIGVFVGCARTAGSVAYFYLLPVLLAGFALCALAVRAAVRIDSLRNHDWVDQVERLAGRDFGYLLFALAALNRLQYFAWATAFGTYVFATILTFLTRRQTLHNRPTRPRLVDQPTPTSGALVPDPVLTQGHVQ